jgi:hypothetical protein
VSAGRVERSITYGLYVLGRVGKYYGSHLSVAYIWCKVPWASRKKSTKRDTVLDAFMVLCYHLGIMGRHHKGYGL